MTTTPTTLFCIMCQNPIPENRPRTSVTCSDECSRARIAFRRNHERKRECRYCFKPSSPEERSRYQRWRRWEAKNPPPDSELSPEELAERQRRLANPPKPKAE